MTTYISDLQYKYESGNIDAESLANDIETSLQKSARSASRKPSAHNTIPVSDTEQQDDYDYKNLFTNDARKEHSEWNSVLQEDDPKRIWEKIDFNGKFKNNEIKSENTCYEFAEFLEARCSLSYEHTNYEDK